MNSDQLSVTVGSTVSEEHDGKSRGGPEEVKKKKKLNKLRSIKLSKSPSLKPSTRRSKSRFRNIVVDLYSDSENTSCSTSSRLSSFSDAKTDISQKSAPPLTRRSSFKGVKTLTRMSSKKLKKPLMKKSSGGTDLNPMKISSRPTRLVNSDGSRPPRRLNKSEHGESSSSVVSSSDVESTPHSSKSTNVSNALKMSFQASPHTPESRYSSFNGNRRRSVYSKPNSTSPGQKSSARTLTRRASLKSLRVSTKTASTKCKRGSMIKHTEVSHLQNSSVEKATCSSTLKDSKCPEILPVEQGGSESEGVSALNVCSFSYCSLHGHHRHDNVPPLKRLISIRRRLLKSQRSTKAENRLNCRERNSGKAKKGIQTSSMACNAVGPQVDEDYARREAKSNGLGSGYDEEAAEFSDCSSLAEMLVGETSYPLSHLEENMNHTYDIPIVEHNSLVIVPSSVEMSSLECCCTDTKLDKPVSETSDKEEEEEEDEAAAAAFKYEGGDSNSVCNEHCKNGSEPVGENILVDETRIDKPLDELRMLNPDEYAGTRSSSGASLASLSELEHEKTAANNEEKENSEPNYGLFQFPPSTDSEANVPNNGSQRTQLKDPKYVRMWRLMYKHAVKGVNEKVENKSSLDKMDRTEQVEDSQVLLESNGSLSSQGLSELDQDMSVENVDAGEKQMELYQIDAVKLVQEAFDQILLPEIQEQSSDDRSITSGINSDQELLEQGHDDGEEWNRRTESTNSLKEEKMPSKFGDKLDRKVSKSWSNLRKIIILKSFVKAMEKVKKLNKGKPRHLPSRPDPEAEKINLKHQTAEERKNAEEWMIDYALQQVISKLAPPQQRRVAMLVKAFETVLPLPDLQSSPSLNVTEPIKVEEPVQACSNLLVQTDEKTGRKTDEGNCTEVLIGKTSPTAKSENHTDKVNDLPKAEAEAEDLVKFIKIKETTDKDWKEEESSDQPGSFSILLEQIDTKKSCDKLNSDDIVSTGHEVLQNGNVQSVPKQIDVSLISEPDKYGSELYDMKVENENTVSEDGRQLDDEESITANMVISSAPIDSLENAMAARKEENEKDEPKSRAPQGSPPIEKSDSYCTIDVAEGTQMEKQSYMRLWCLVYKHMASSIAAKDGTDVNSEADKERVDNAKTMPETDISVSSQSFSEKHQGKSMKEVTEDNQKAVLRRIEAIKLIEKAIDEIILPENQDNSSNAQSTSSETIQEEETQGNVVEGEPFILGSNESDSANESLREHGRKEAEDCRVPEHEEVATNNITVQAEQQTSSNQKVPNSWSNLKKMILLKRFIKALENVRKFSPRGPRFLPLEVDPEAEKVNLKHQDIDERKNAEEWMLDYALQQAVAKLTPARKRKVKLLVEAFETVTPTIRT